MSENSGIDKALLIKAQKEVSRAVVTLLREEPFYGHILASVNRSFEQRIRTAAVAYRGNRAVLIINPEFFVKKITRKSERVAIVKHEMLHLLFDHLGRVDWERIHRKIYNLAADLVVNQFVGKKWALPKGAVRLDSFDFALPKDKSVEWYYKELLKNSVFFSVSFQSSHSDHSEWSRSGTTLSRYELGRILRDARARSSRHYSNVPDPIKRLVEACIAEIEPSVDWRRILRMFSVSSRRSRVANTLRRPSKRYGTFPGTKVKRFQRMALIIDTSGSVNDDLLALFFAEIHGIWRQGAEILVVEADETVQRTWEYAGGGPPSVVGGRGGTCFDPALSWVADAPVRFDAAVYLTDGYAAEPTVRPRCKLLWVIPESGTAKVLQGEKVVRITK